MAAPERRSGLRHAGDFHPAAPAVPAEEAATAAGPPIAAVPAVPAHLTPVAAPAESEAAPSAALAESEPTPSASAPSDVPVDPAKEPVQMLSARMPTSLHKRVRVHAVTRDESVQDFVTRAVTKLLQEEGG